MSQPYLGEVRIMAFDHAPSGWAPCDGQLLSVEAYPDLYALLGTSFGGDGIDTFALPDLRGRVPIHCSFANPLGESSGEEGHSLTVDQMPAHSHLVTASSNSSDSFTPTNNYWGNTGMEAYAPAANAPGTMSVLEGSMTGDGQPHENRPPFVTLNFCIALRGEFPSPNR